MEITVEGLDKAIKSFDKFVKKNDIAISRAMNSKLNTSRNKAVRHVKQAKWNMKISDLKKLTTITKATKNKTEVEFTLKSNPIPLIKFGATEQYYKRKKETKVSYKLKGKKRSMPKSFIMPSKFGNKQDEVFARSSKDKKKVTRKVAITPTSMFSGSQAEDVFIKTFMEDYEKRYLQQIEFLTK